MKGEITYDLVMDDDMPFVEGCYRLDDGVWKVFIFSKSEGLREVGVRKDVVWKSGVTGLTIVVSDDTILNKETVLKALSDALGVTEWSEVRGPDSIQIR